MTTSTAYPSLSSLTPIGLDELTDRAALQTRVDRKYLLSIDAAWSLVAEVSTDVRILEIDGMRSFAYRSVYFDTPDLAAYLATAHRRRRRFKIRTRTYLDSGLCWLEVKTRGVRGSTVKDRLPYEADHHTTIAPGQRFVERVLAQKAALALDGASPFAPSLVTRYRRSTLYLPATDSRITIDTDLEWEDEDRRVLRLPELAIVETKTGSTASCVDRLLWSLGHRPARISKYATGLAALRPDLPATRWRRTLSRHFATACVAAPARRPAHALPEADEVRFAEYAPAGAGAWPPPSRPAPVSWPPATTWPVAATWPAAPSTSGAVG